MDRRPTLEARPPVLIDAIVRTLIPPACREHVVGDLWERYRSPFSIAIVFIMPLMSSTNWFLRIGWALGSAYGLYVAAFMLLHRTRPMPDGLGFHESLVYYRNELVRRHGYVPTMWLWYLLPGALAMTFIMVGGAVAAAERGRPLWPAAVTVAIVAGVGWIIHSSSRDMAQKLRVRIDTLGSAEER